MSLQSWMRLMTVNLRKEFPKNREFFSNVHVYPDHSECLNAGFESVGTREPKILHF